MTENESSMKSPADPVTEALAEVLARAEQITSGAVADYIPELASADPDELAISAVSVGGGAYRAGTCEQTFTIQSISKPFVYALALSDLGLDEVHRHVGFEPSGEPFNAISLDDSGRPANPMINAGAMVASGLVESENAQSRFERIRGCLSAFAGRALQIDPRVYASEAATGHRNRALAYLTLSTGALTREVDDATDVYFRQCALLVTAADLSVMGATLANDGRNPLTGVQVVSSEVARHVLSMMGSCGMYDRAGEWAIRVGMPAKSGVAGGIVAVKPGQFGIGVYSPRLDESGNSSRGTEALALLSHEYGLHLLQHPQSPVSPVHELTGSLASGVTVALRGEIDFIAFERLAHEIRQRTGGDPAGAASLTIDLTLVTRIGPTGARLLAAAANGATAWGSAVAVIDPSALIARGGSAGDVVF